MASPQRFRFIFTNATAEAPHRCGDVRGRELHVELRIPLQIQTGKDSISLVLFAVEENQSPTPTQSIKMTPRPIFGCTVQMIPRPIFGCTVQSAEPVNEMIPRPIFGCTVQSAEPVNEAIPRPIFGCTVQKEDF
ncbi:hypothetical protein K490DRAFT_65747 [Saccharata proteae CBS 121410]|uniref:Uncharacterized protein n=1 Tax=Saccharata proteae CBS 121410 TaxID=1314787 RepID=A0A9P4HST8_9PEZI|nr:hypothetical protein K490DRAFT_65747 [Saccharata proteae CBS 121410]